MKTKDIKLTASAGMREEYNAVVLRMPEMKPIEGSDFLAQAIVDGFSIVVGKNDFKPGQPVIYIKNECQINADFLSVNNMFEISERHLNKNYEQVQALMDEGKQDEAKKLVGFFNKHGRVRMIKLRGCPSMGIILKQESLANWMPGFENVDLEQYLIKDEDGHEHSFGFDTVGDKLFVQAYVPQVSNQGSGCPKGQKGKTRYEDRIDREVPGQFNLHYDTLQINDNMWQIKPEDEVFISVKVHGTSAIYANVLINIPVQLSKLKAGRNKSIRKQIKTVDKHWPSRFYWQRWVKANRITNLNHQMYDETKRGYGLMFSSRNVILNKYAYKKAHSESIDIRKPYLDMLAPYMPQGMTIYGEVFGYVTGGQSMVQKQYDYGCKPGCNMFMPYRITFTDEQGNRIEWNASEVWGWTLKLLKDHPELQAHILPLTKVYQGKLTDLYPDIPVDENWQKNILERMKQDKATLGMEEKEPLCKCKVPREGVVIRIENRPEVRALKLKSNAFREREAKAIDAGEVDQEMAGSY